DFPGLTLTLPALVSEADAIRSHAATVRLAAMLPTNLVVTLSSADTSELAVPATVTIPAGQFEAAFSLIAMNDEIVDDRQTVTVTAGAPGFPSAAATLEVL